MSRAFTPKDMTGRVFDNREDRRSRKAPDYTGLANINGQILRVAAWYNPPSERSPKGNISLKFVDRAEWEAEQAERLATAARNQQAAPPPTQGDLDNDIPF